ncbi:MAG: sulfatase [Acidimicrobiia bacterium]
MTAPDIVVVLSDQQRPDTCGIYGQRLPVTPNLDAMAAAGVVFDQAFTVQPLCGPSRASIQTGLVPTRLGCWRNGLALPVGVETLATRLGALGYRTSYVGKWHLASDRGRLPPGRVPARLATKPVPVERRGGYVDGWFAADALEHTSRPYTGHVYDAAGARVDLHGYRVDALTDLALAELRVPDDRPRLLFVSYLEPHHQNGLGRGVGPKGWAAGFAEPDVPGDLSGRLGEWRWSAAEYLAACASVDANLGRILAAVDARAAQRSGVRDARETLVVFASDHGNHFRTRNAGFKRSCHDASIRVPLVLRGPGFDTGERCGALVTLLDLVPTLVVAAGGEDPGVDGQALQQVLRGTSRAELLVQISESQIGRALRTTSHTYSVRAPDRRPGHGRSRPAADLYVEDKCYDNLADPAQRRNLVADPATAVLRAELAERLGRAIEEVEGLRPRIVSRREYHAGSPSPLRPRGRERESRGRAP